MKMLLSDPVIALNITLFNEAKFMKICSYGRYENYYWSDDQMREFINSAVEDNIF